GPGAVLQLRNLNLAPGKSVSVSATATMPCNPTAAPYTFTTQVKQSNDFLGTGNDFTITGAQPAVAIIGQCSLAFGTQPASQQKASDITSDAFLGLAGGGHGIQVKVLDGGGVNLVTWWHTAVVLGIATNPGGGTLSGTTSVLPSGGVATFSTSPGPNIDKAASGYQLNATSDGIVATPPKSNAFNIVDSGQRCRGGQTCSGTTSNAKNSVNVSGTATNDNDLLIITLGGPTAPVIQCGAYIATTDTAQEDFVTSTGGPSGGLTSTMTLFAPFVTKPASKYIACLGSTEPFLTRTPGVQATKADTNGDGIPDLFVGQPPDCAKKPPIALPCQTPAVKDAAGNVSMTVFTAPGDPPWRF